jgi:hypothetical protein
LSSTFMVYRTSSSDEHGLGSGTILTTGKVHH